MSVLFVDYDDTLFPTTQIMMKNYNEEKMLELEKKIIIFLSGAVDIFSYIYIVSNASEVWIRHTLHQYMSKLNTFIKITKKIFVLSASDIFPRYDAVKRKEKIFSTFLSCSDVKESMSIGDSDVDTAAYKNAVKSLNNRKHLEKVVKLHEGPDMSDMIFQIEFLSKNIKSYVNESTSFEHTFNKIIEVSSE
jgi:hypothetical protein